MDLEYGEQVWNNIMNNPDFTSSGLDDDEIREAMNSGDPAAMLKLMGLGSEGGPPLPTSFPSPAEVRAQALILSQKVLDRWDSLKVIVERWESAIQKRWLKKTREQRKKILLGAWPGMPSMHRPDFDAFKSKSRGSVGDSKRAAYMWPYMNLDDLSKPMPLLLLLKTRGRNPPAAFSQADSKATHLGHVTGVLVPAFLNNHVMMFTDRHTPLTYGELIAWDDHPEAFFWLQSQRGFHPGEGILVLEIQLRLYEFCIESCKGILHDKSSVELEDLSIPVKPEPPLLSGNETGTATLALTASEGPYRLPMNLDLKRLESILAAKLAAAEDHLWALREDPDYYAASVAEAMEHRLECVVDINGQKHPLIGNPLKTHILWGRVIGNVISSSLMAIEMWDSLHKQVLDLQVLKEKYAKTISPRKDLPEDYALKFYHFLHHLVQFSKGSISDLKMGAFAAPPLRPFFEREPQDPSNTMIQLKGKSGLPRDKIRDELVWIFNTLYDPQRLHIVGLNILMDELGQQMETVPKMNELISSWVADRISDLSVISQCIHQITLYQPWAASFDDSMVGQKDKIQQDWLVTEKLIASIIKTKYSGSVTSLGTPLSGRFYYPVDQRKTRQNTESMRSAEENLDALWQAIDRDLANQNAISPHLKHLLSSRVLERTPEWIEPTKKPIAPASDQSQLLLEQRLRLERSTESTVDKDDAPISKNKKKTRGTADSSRVEDEPILAEQSQAITQEEVKVDKRALKVFKTIFFTPSASSQPGELAWVDFLHAMVSTGFVAEKFYGSVWQFTPTRLDVERGINFHEPHPSGKLPFKVARRYGRRLSRTYGWNGDMFVLS